MNSRKELDSIFMSATGQKRTKTTGHSPATVSAVFKQTRLPVYVWLITKTFGKIDSISLVGGF